MADTDTRARPGGGAAVPGSPFGVVVTPDRRWAFVSLESSVEVLRAGRSLAPCRS